MDRQFWITHANLAARPLVVASRILPPKLLLHLLYNRSTSAVQQKHGHCILPLQGACASLYVPLVFPCWMNAAPVFRNGHHAARALKPGEPPLVVCSALIHPDFEFDSITMEAIRLESVPVEGIPDPATYEDADMKRMLVHHLTRTHRLPAAAEADLSSPNFFVVKNRVLSYEMLHNIVHIQINLEQRGLDLIAEKHGLKLAYTWDPPAIFAKQIGYEILDELFLSAITAPGVLSSHITAIAFNDFQNKTIVPRLARALPNVAVMPKFELPMEQLKVLHTNSDAFGKHILTQPLETSLDGAIGSMSSAAASFCFHEPGIRWI